MTLLLGIPDYFWLYLLGNVALNGLIGGFLAWLIGSSGRQGRLGIVHLLAIGASFSVMLCVLLALVMALTAPRRFDPALGTIVVGQVFLSLPLIAACMLAALAVNVWHARKSRC